MQDDPANRILPPIRRWIEALKSVQDSQLRAQEESTQPPEIAFTTLAPSNGASAPPPTLASLGVPWIRAHSESFLFTRAQALLRERCVHLEAVDETHVYAATTGRAPHRQVVLFFTDRLILDCSCRPPRIHVFSEGIYRDRLPCEHLIAALLAVVNAQESPLVSVSITGEMLCPITRLPLRSGQKMYQCLHCGQFYSPEGWEFLRKMDRGRCCACRQRKTIALAEPTLPEAL